jgi:NADPH:quinone reductase-like Zn-dependent oxidoreductase
MKAFTQQHYGSPDVLELEEVDRPVPGDDDVLIRVLGAAVNPLDWHVMRGSPMWARSMLGMRRPKVRNRGVDVAGQVEAVGRSVQDLRVGDEVFGWCRGAFAEYACAKADHFATKPARLTHAEAAAVPLAGMTALQGLRDAGRIERGQSVLIVGATGGVGTFAVQIAKAFGAIVTGVCSTGGVELARSIGADHVIDHAKEDVTRRGERYDLIFELAGTRSPVAYRRALTPAGTLVLSSGSGLVIDRMLTAVVLGKVVRQRMTFLETTQNHDDLVILRDMIDAGTVTPVIDRSYPFDDVREAIRYLEGGHARGKTVITV